MGAFINGQWYPDNQVTLLPSGDYELKHGVRPSATVRPVPPVREEVKEPDSTGASRTAAEPASRPDPAERQTKVIEPSQPNSPIHTKHDKA